MSSILDNNDLNKFLSRYVSKRYNGGLTETSICESCRSHTNLKPNVVRLEGLGTGFL